MKNKFTSSIVIILLFFSNTVFADKTEGIGTALQILIPATALGATLGYEKGGNSQGTRQFAKSLGTTMLLTGALKAIVNKQRPDGSGNNDSFPSGHTSAAFMGASFIQQRYGLKSAILPYIGATYVGYSRVHANKHDISDVVAGAAIGILSTRYFTTPYKNLSVMPLLDSDRVGVGLSKRW